MVQLWAEKELRNYKRLQRAGVPVFALGGTLGAFKDARRRKLLARFELRPQAPRPALLKGHVLAMDFVGSNGWPAPRLHEAELDEERLRDARVRRADRSLIDARGYDVDGPWRDESRRTPAAATWIFSGVRLFGRDAVAAASLLSTEYPRGTPRRCGDASKE